MEAYRVFADDYLARHSRSNRRKRDGWWYDLHENLSRAARKAQREYYEDEYEDEDLELRDEDDDEDEYEDDEDDEDDEQGRR
jgi:hypothetical protein